MLSSTISVDRTRTHVLVVLRGEIDLSLHDEVDGALAEVARARLPVVIDLADATFVGATGVGFVERCRSLCAQAGQTCVVRHVPAAVARVFVALDLGDLGERDPSAAEPVA